MPRFEVYDTNKQSPEPTRFQMVADSAGICIQIVNANGAFRCAVARISNSGCILRYPGIPNGFGLELDGQGCIVVE